MIRILHIFGQMNRGGAEMRTLDLMRYHNNSQYQFNYCTLSGLPGTLDDEIRSLGGEIYPCALNLSFPRRFRKLLREQQFDVVHSHVHHFSGFILRLAQKENIPVRIAHFRNTSDGQISNLRRVIQRRVMRHWIDQYATDILAVSEGAMNYSWHNDWQSDKRCRVIYNGIDGEKFAIDCERSKVLAEFNIPTESKIYIHVGRMDPPKNHKRIMSIFSEIAQQDKSAHLLLIGRRRLEVEVMINEQALLQNIQNRVIVIGERNDIPQFLNIADVLLFPSLWEGLPGVVLEACAAGIPVLGSDLPGIREIASFISGIETLSLDQSDVVWANTAQKLVKQHSKEKIRQDFEQSPFMIEQCARNFISIWNQTNEDCNSN